MSSSAYVAFNDSFLEEFPTWTKLLGFAEWETNRGRAYEIDRTETGTATIKLYDTLGSYDVGVGTGSGPAALQPLKQIKIDAVNPFTGVTTTQFRGYIEDWTFDIDPTERLQTVTISCVDHFDVIGGTEVDPGSDGTADYAAARVDDRLRAVLEDIATMAGLTDWPASWKNLFTGNVIVQGVKYQPGTDLLTVMRDAADAEFPGVSNIFMSKEGVVCFRGRLARLRYQNYLARDPANPTQPAQPGEGDRFASKSYPGMSWNLGDAGAVRADHQAWTDLFTARPKLLVNGWLPNHSYFNDLTAMYPGWTSGNQVIQFLLPTGFSDIFAAQFAIGSTSQASEPNWASAPNVGDGVADTGTFQGWFNCGPLSGLPFFSINPWATNTVYAEGAAAVTPSTPDGRVKVMFPGYGGIDTTGGSEPPWVNDGINPDDGGYWLDMGMVSFTPAQTGHWASISEVGWMVDKVRIINVCLATPEGILPKQISAARTGAPFGQLYKDDVSISIYGPRSQKFEGLIVRNGIENLTTASPPIPYKDKLDECLKFADYYVDNYSHPHVRISHCLLRSQDPNDAASYLGHWNFLHGVEIGDVVFVTTHTPGNGGFQATPFFVEGIHNTVTPATSGYDHWEMTLDLSAQAWYVDDPFSIE
jgi:hypothetical protein